MNYFRVTVGQGQGITQLGPIPQGSPKRLQSRCLPGLGSPRKAQSRKHPGPMLMWLLAISVPYVLLNWEPLFFSDFWSQVTLSPLPHGAIHMATCFTNASNGESQLARWVTVVCNLITCNLYWLDAHTQSKGSTQGCKTPGSRLGPVIVSTWHRTHRWQAHVFKPPCLTGSLHSLSIKSNPLTPIKWLSLRSTVTSILQNPVMYPKSSPYSNNQQQLAHCFPEAFYSLGFGDTLPVFFYPQLLSLCLRFLCAFSLFFLTSKCLGTGATGLHFSPLLFCHHTH